MPKYIQKVYFFTCHANVSTLTTGIKPIFKSAIKEWCSETSIAWRISENSSLVSTDILGANSIKILSPWFLPIFSKILKRKQQ